jgi:RimJ/RimL family protein N-acetyltransferase
VVIFDLGDPTPMFDLRIAAGSRGRGYGTGTVQWLTARVFSTGADKERIEATTRADNWAMRAVLARCGYTKEAHYRQAWSGPGGACDAVGYAILRTDWSTGTTTPVNWDDEPPARPSS